MPSRREFLQNTAFLATAGAMASSAAGESSPSQPSGGVTETYTIHMGQREKFDIPPRKIVIPDVDGFKVLKGDYHIHTLFSDGLVMPDARVNEAVDNGLDAIAITDHIEHRPFFGGKGKWKLQGEINDNHNISYEIAKPLADRRKLLLVRGTEITKSKLPPGHFNALFLEDANAVAAVVDDWREMLRVAAEQGAFLLWNHPGWEAQIGKNCPLRFTPEHEEALKKGWMHGIEIYGYGPDFYPVVSDWCNEKDLAIIANSDIHRTELETYGRQNPLRPITLALAKERTVESLKEAFLAKRTIGWASGLLWGRSPWLPALFKACVKVKEITPGKLEFTNTSSLPCTVSAGGAVFELTTGVPRPVYRSVKTDSVKVLNWMIGMDKTLEIPIKELV